MRRSLHPLFALCAAFALPACGGGGTGETESGSTTGTTGEPFVCPESDNPDKPERLCEWGFFEGDGSDQAPVAGVIPFTVISNLFTDDAAKLRFLWLPEGATMTYEPLEPWTFPVGAALIKTFAYPVDANDPSLGMHLVETRLLVHDGANEWTPHVYRWNEENTEATRFVAGGRLDVSWTDASGELREHEYRIPSLDDCKICHGGKSKSTPLGPRTRQLDTTYDYGDGPINQIDHFASLGLFSNTPDAAGTREHLVDPYGDAPIEDRARSYLDSNCSGCHRQGGDAQSSGLWLNWENDDELHLGICKGPVAAGNGGGGLDYDIVPGDPDASVFVFRMESSEADIKMPELGGLQPDWDGAQLIRDWIAQMEPVGCEPEPEP